MRAFRHGLTAAATAALACAVVCGLGAAQARAQLFEPAEDEPVPVFAQPARTPPAARAAGTTAAAADRGDEPSVSFDAFSEPIELTELVDFVGAELGVNVIIRGQLTGSIVFNAPVEVPRSRLLGLLDAMLEQYGFTVVRDDTTGFYLVVPVGEVRPTFGAGEDGATTSKVIRTPNVKPSLLQQPVQTLLGQGQTGNIAYLDELGVLVVTGSPRTISRVESLVGQLLAVREDIRYHRLPLEHVAAPVARTLAIGLSGSQSGSGGNVANVVRRANNANNQQNIDTAAALGGQTLNNLGDRLTVDPQGNALLFRGTDDELDAVRELIELIDEPIPFEPRSYFAGSAALQIAEIASQQGLGDIIRLDNEQDTGLSIGNRQNAQQTTTQQSSVTGGPIMVVDPARGSIVYYGTPSQQAELDSLLEELGIEDERVVIRTYVLEHSLAEDVADLLEAIITGRSATGESSLLPESTGRAQVRRDLEPVATPEGVRLQGAGGDDVSAAFDPDQVVVVPDVPNNQIVVRAPLAQQEELNKLVAKLDLRRAQVYIEALIVSVNDTANSRFAIETQILNGQYGIQTNFGLSSQEGGFLDQRTVATGLSGLTSALIQSESIPLIINAVRTDTDGRIVSSPSLLVNNNEEASIVSLEEQPTTSTSQGDNSTITSFDGFEDAGTNLLVTPSISDGGYLRLTYEVELSSFIGTSTGDGIPPARTTNTVSSAVTVPSDATIVVGGIKVSNTQETVIKVPFIGDIPIVGELFRDTTKTTTNSVLYIFITPRIMSDPNFLDLKLYTKGPQSAVEIDDAAPDLDPIVIESVGMAPAGGE